jgi:ferritin-like metal-binding protein YciE
MVGNESIILKPERHRLAFSHQALKVVRPPCALALLGDTLDCFQQNHPRLTRRAPGSCHADFLAGTLLYLARAFESPIAIACFLLFTGLAAATALERAALRRFMAPCTSFEAFTTHREETQGQIERLEQVFEMIGKRPQAKPCEAINCIVAEGEETIEEFGESPAIDTGLVAAGQAVEHYEMARYGALIAWAGQLNLPKAAALLNESLQEEMKAEKLLTQIGASKADKMAATKLAA